ncbi:MAG: hypothetical protein ABIQ02_08565 [Saprospiraceae bacterium]
MDNELLAAQTLTKDDLENMETKGDKALLAPNLDFILEVLYIFQRCDSHEELYWKVERPNFKFFAICNDVFYWGTADLEEILPEDVELLRECWYDLKKIGEAYMLATLFSARKRKMRPQYPMGRIYDRENKCYTGDMWKPELRALFDACGPERDSKDEG